MTSRFSTYTPVELTNLYAALDGAWAEISSGSFEPNVTREMLAERILDAAARGERNVGRLKAAALGNRDPGPSPPVR